MLPQPDDDLIAVDEHASGPWRSDALGPWPCVRPGSRLTACRLGPWTEVMAGSRLHDVQLGAYSYLAGDCELIHTDIGRFSSLARCLRINPGQHPMERATQHHCTYRRAQYGFGVDDETFFASRAQARVRIGHDVWIGHGVVIMPGLSIGDGAVVGAGAIVTRDVAPYAVVAGVPARFRRWRVAEALIPRLQALAWWHWDRATLEARFNDLRGTPEALLARYGDATP